jgi:hypothetical protein
MELLAAVRLWDQPGCSDVVYKSICTQLDKIRKGVSKMTAESLKLTGAGAFKLPGCVTPAVFRNYLLRNYLLHCAVSKLDTLAVLPCKMSHPLLNKGHPCSQMPLAAVGSHLARLTK